MLIRRLSRFWTAFIYNVSCNESVVNNVNQLIFPSLLSLSLLELLQGSTHAAGRSLVSIVVDHIFLCIKDAGLCFSLKIGYVLFV